MPKTLTLGSLFDGIGGWPLAAIHAGVEPVWASEIDDFPAAVTAYHFPDMVQLGDITKINVDELEPVDIICAGSPCQDLSVAGKREGLSGERSGLFRTAIKLVHGLRERTGKPRYFVWENVPGAFSSNKGNDFRAVLEEITKTQIPMPKDGRWAESGCVEWGGTSSLAWRTLDAQYWGVPQRRKRIFLVADFDGRSAAEILFVEQGLHGHFAESQGEGQEAAGNVGASIDSANGTLTPWDVQSKRIQSIDGKAATLYGGAGQGTHNGAVFDTRQVVYSFDSKASNSMKSANPHSGCRQVEIAKCLDTTVPDPSKNQGGIAIYDMTHADEVMHPVTGDKSNCLNSRTGTGGNQVPITHSVSVRGDTPLVSVNEGFRESSFGTFEGDNKAGTLKASGGVLGGERNINKRVVGSLCACDYKGVGNQYVSEGKLIYGVQDNRKPPQ